MRMRGHSVGSVPRGRSNGKRLARAGVLASGLVVGLGLVGCDDLVSRAPPTRPSAELVAALRERCPVRTARALELLIEQPQHWDHRSKTEHHHEGAVDGGLAEARRAVESYIEGELGSAMSRANLEELFPERPLYYQVLWDRKPDLAESLLRSSRGESRPLDDMILPGVEVVVLVDEVDIVTRHAQGPLASFSEPGALQPYVGGLKASARLRVNRERIPAGEVELSSGSIAVPCTISLSVTGPMQGFGHMDLMLGTKPAEAVELSARVGGVTLVRGESARVNAEYSTEDWKASTMVHMGDGEVRWKYSISPGTGTLRGRVYDPSALSAEGARLAVLKAQADAIAGKTVWSERLGRWVRAGELPPDRLAEVRAAFPGFLGMVEGGPADLAEDERLAEELAAIGVVGSERIVVLVERCVESWKRGEPVDVVALAQAGDR